ncbi:MAG: hypothetical protein FWG05_00290, partial [Kiritimatiellaeota bacterium]|nr:hypothetical protein [Kiritimatiellota bacterium]
MKKSIATISTAVAFVVAAAADVVLIRDTFSYMDFLKDIAGSEPNAVNAVGSQWIAISDNAYTQPSINGSRTS